MRYVAGIIVGLVALLAASSASAQFAAQVGVQTGGSIATTEVSVGPVGIDGVGMHSSRPDIGVRGGVDFRVANSPFVLGVFGEYNNQDVKFSVNPGLFSASLTD